MSFVIRDSNFMMLEDSTFNFLHGCWNYCFIKTNIHVMILFKFDIKCVKLNFKATASMEFCFDLKINLLCSYDGSLFMKNRCDEFWRVLTDRMFLFDQLNGNWESIESTWDFVMNLFNFQPIEIPFDISNLPFRLIE